MQESLSPSLAVSERKPDGQTFARFKDRIIRTLPIRLLTACRLFRTGDWKSVLSFIFEKKSRLSLATRIRFIRRIYSVSNHVPCEHLQSEILAFVRQMLALSSETHGCIVEAGCFKGGGTAKLSIAAKLTGRKLVAFDSFEGIAAHEEIYQQTIWGGPVEFSPGEYSGTLEEVRANVSRHGEVDVCEFVKGQFEDTLPSFHHPVAAAFLDVDLASSTRTCLRHLWALLVPGGFLFSHDGHLPLVLDVFRDDDFWLRELGCARPEIQGLGSRKLIWLQKPPLQTVE